MQIDSLVDYLYKFTDCPFISDMPRLPKNKKQSLVKYIQALPSDVTSLHSWNDALQFLTKCPPKDTPTEARSELIKQLQKGDVPNL